MNIQENANKNIKSQSLEALFVYLNKMKGVARKKLDSIISILSSLSQVFF